MKILQVIQKPQLRGAEMFASQLGNHLIALGHECKLISIFEGRDNLPFKGRMITMNRPLEKRLWDWQGWKTFADVVVAEKPDVIQLNAGDTLKFAVLSKLFFKWNAPLVFRNASMPSLYIRNSITKFFNGILYRHVNAIASVSERSREDLNRLFPDTIRKSVVIPVGIEAVKFESVPKLTGVKVLVHVGGFTFEKNHRGLINIFELIQQSMPNVKLWLVGDGPLRANIEKLVHEKKLSSDVTFFGYVKDPMRYISAADALLMPSIIEGLPAVLLEAMYCKCPVVSYDVGGIFEIVKEKETGLLTPVHAERQMADAVTFLFNNPDQRERMVIAAYKLVTTKFNNAHVATRFVSLYDHVGEGHSQSKESTPDDKYLMHGD